MNRGLQQVLDVVQKDGCPLCVEPPGPIQVNGPDEIFLGCCGHVADAKRWLDAVN